MHSNLFPVSMQQINIFFAVVESNSFTKAAAKLNLTQSAVSKSIAKLEKDMDLMLFTRHYREIRITAEGKKLYDYWKEPIRQISDSYKKCYTKQHMRLNTLRIGVDHTTNLDSYFWPLIEKLRKKNPDIQIDPDSDSREHLIEKLRQDQLDLILIPDFMRYRIERMNLCWKWAAKEVAQILIPRQHPLADKELSIQDLDQVPIAIINDLEQPENYQYWKEVFASKGCQLKLSENVYRNPESIIEFYRMNDIMLTDKYFKFDEKKWNVIRKPVAGIENGIIAVWNPEKESEALKSFLLL